MSPDLPEKLLGISIDDPSDRPSREGGSGDEEEATRFTFVSIGELRVAIEVDDVKTITEPPLELTRVPRAPESIDGVTDLRGEVTAVIDPRVHFPVLESPPSDQRLVVFDRPSDEQQAAIRVDEVLGVELIPERNVREVDDVEAEVSGGLGRHPLVDVVVRRERRTAVSEATKVAAEATATEDTDPDRRTDPSAGGSDDDPFAGETFELEDGSDGSVTERGADEPDDVDVEVTAVLDVDGLLSAVGRSD